MVLKGLSGQFLAARHLVPLPTDADFIQGDTARGVNHVQEPQITAKQGRGVIRQGVHRSKVFHKDKKGFRQNSAEALVFLSGTQFFHRFDQLRSFGIRIDPVYHIEAFIPQKFRYHIERGARVRQMGSEGMPTDVEREAFPDSGFLSQHFQFPVYTTIR